MRLNEPEKLGAMLDEIKRRLGLLENSQRSAVAVLAADPTNPRNGDIWIRTSDGTLRVRIGGVTKTATLTP